MDLKNMRIATLHSVEKDLAEGTWNIGEPYRYLNSSRALHAREIQL